MLRILAGLEDADEGTVTRTPPEQTVGYLPQEPDVHSHETLLAYLARRTGVAAADADLEQLAAELERDPSAAAPYAAALEHFLALGGDDLPARARTACADVGLAPERLEQQVGTLSGGEAARAALAAILLARFDVFLLDEPTNDLDFAGLDLLERFVDGLPGGAVVVSHDRAFLDRCVNRIFELDEDAPGGRAYAGGWSAYAEARDRERVQRGEEYERYVAERERLRERARRQREWAEAGVRRAKRRRTDNAKSLWDARAEGAQNLAARAKVTERRLERLDPVEKPWEPWQLRLALVPEGRSGELVVRLDAAVLERGSFGLGPVDLEVRWQDRLAILGPNGSGKTTLLQAILGTLPLSRGTRRLGERVLLGALEQRREAFAGPDPLLRIFVGAAAVSEANARSLLAKFGLGADDVTRAGSTLSPGERTRATLAAFVASGVNCLVLDEPTNHLDLPAIEELEAALDRYGGTLLLVTHDRRFLENVRVTRTLELPARGGRRTSDRSQEPVARSSRSTRSGA